jgi:hypothetical protein
MQMMVETFGWVFVTCCLHLFLNFIFFQAVIRTLHLSESDKTWVLSHTRTKEKEKHSKNKLLLSGLDVTNYHVFDFFLLYPKPDKFKIKNKIIVELKKHF